MKRKFKGVIPEIKGLAYRIGGIVFPANGGISDEYRKLRDAEVWYTNTLGLFLTTSSEKPRIGGIALTVDSAFKETDLISPIRIGTPTLTDLKDRIESTSKVDMIQIYIEAVKMLSVNEYQKLADSNYDPNEFGNRIFTNISKMVGFKFDNTSSLIPKIINKLGGKQMCYYRVKECIVSILEDKEIIPSKCYTCRNCRYNPRYRTPFCMEGHITLNDNLTVREINVLYPEVSCYRHYNPHTGRYDINGVTESEFTPLPIEECPHMRYISR